MIQKQNKSIFAKITVCCMLGAFFAFYFTVNPIKIAVVVALMILSIWLTTWNNSIGFSFNRTLVIFELSIIIFSAVRFYEYWIKSNKMGKLAAVIGVSPELLLIIVAAFIAAFSFFGFNIFLCSLLHFASVVKKKLRLGEHPFIRNLIIITVLVAAQFFQLQRSSLDYFPNIFQIHFSYLLINCTALLFLNLLIVILFRLGKYASIAICTVITVFSIANYYVILLHGSPLFPSEFSNTKTALTVISSYKFSISTQIIDIVAVFLAELHLSGLFHQSERQHHTLRRELAISAFCAVALYTGLFSPIALNNAWPFSWNASVMYGGFLCSAISDVKNSLHPLLAPTGYDAGQIIIPDVDNSGAVTEYPDIILILNESFCDLNYYTEIQSDHDCLAQFYGIENACYGVAFSPNIGGGTNDSEFEFLTSYSMKLLASSAPFNNISFNEKNATLLSYLKSLGYSTTAMHNSTPYNYSRHIAYPAMGFEHVYLGKNSFSETNYYGVRPVLDKDDYAGMISLYEKDAEGPRFYYLLTYQNHGGWEQNDSSLDTIHTTMNMGNLTDDLDE